MKSRGRKLLRGAWALAGVLLGACAQDPNTVRVNIGTGLVDPKPAADYAALYLPYAKMASIAYTDAKFLKPRPGPNPDCPDLQRLVHLPPDTDDQRTRKPNIIKWLTELRSDGWSCLFGLNDPPGCPHDLPRCNPLPGLELHVWMRQCEAVIAIRGTDNQPGDWQSNLRWFLRPLHLFDEYRQVQFHISNIVRQIRNACRSAHIVLTGHSLGGGLAQHAAYAAGGAIRYVYAFDPSPVIGYFDIAQDVRIKARQGLGIDYVFEAGEVLDLPRFVIGGFANPQPCNPRVRIVRFNATNVGSSVKQHAMQSLTETIQKLGRGGSAARAREEHKTRNCTFV